MPALELPTEWRFDASSSSFVTDSALVRVVALPAEKAALLPGACSEAERLTELLLERTGLKGVSAKQVTTRAFTEEPGAPPSRTVLVYHYATPEDVAKETATMAVFTRVYASEGNVFVSAISDNQELPEAVQKEVLRAVVVVTEEIAEAIARYELQGDETTTRTRASLIIQRGLLGVSDFQKSLYEDAGFSAALTDRIEMTATLGELADRTDTDTDGIEIRPLDLLHDDLVRVYNLVKLAFGSAPISHEAWKRHYWQQPRLAADLSFVAWRGDEPVSAVIIELIVEGEGGGEEEVHAMFETEAQLSERQAGAEEASTALQFAEDFEERQRKIQGTATAGNVVAVATAPSSRGLRLAQCVLEHSFHAAKRAGLVSIGLSTDRQNAGAIRTYIRAGMAETKTSNGGYALAREFVLSP